MKRPGRLQKHLREVYHRLYARFGPQGWWPGEGAFEICLGAILTQNTAWPNVVKALDNLKAAGAFSPAALRALPQEELARLLRPAGYFNSKARKVKAFVEHLAKYGDDLGAFLSQQAEPLRAELLSLYGIGPETADDIVLYAAHKPTFVVDAYTVRILQRLGIKPLQETYEGYRALFRDNLPKDIQMYNEYHALLVRLGKSICRPRPLCEQCPLLDLCPTGLSTQGCESQFAAGHQQDHP